MTLSWKCILPLLLATILLAGCNEKSGGSGWSGLPSTCKLVAEWVNDGTNWVLNKNQVSVVKVGEVRSPSGTSSFVADFKIGVTNGTNSFETLATDVPCDKDGIPTEDSVTKLREAVESIKSKIKRLQK
jgi:hypothetical protein